MTELRAGVLRPWQEGKKQSEMAGDLNVPKQTVSYAVKRFRETNSNGDRARIERPAAATTPENIQSIKRKICHCKGHTEGHIHSKRNSVRKVEKQLEVLQLV